MPHEHPGPAARARCRVIADREIDYPNPIVLNAGDAVQVGRRDTTWPSFVWCTAHNGVSGWVPDSYLQRNGEGARAARDYDATELAIRVGEELSILDAIGGWLWCANQQGQNGWVPEENVQRVISN